ncbi:hypothetical protein TELCIR_20307 [Teladorsagia circumcincta]|uniref:SSD domain-containing protein n=1 Tax=Teladorsagia circumcincta TaxID=45464 RepID=A0A2G9TJW5_TELCI|nr:hypothetical protein TELCIR_20307 [Teladorsagia circumcincta]
MAATGKVTRRKKGLKSAMSFEEAIEIISKLASSVFHNAGTFPAVGVDNVFILLSAWRSSPTHQSLQKRMEETFADAGVSITVTSLTDFISFAVGCATPFPSVQMFCAYAVTAVLFTYVYQLTFFAGIMVYTNRREMDNRNCITFRKIKKGSPPSITFHKF